MSLREKLRFLCEGYEVAKDYAEWFGYFDKYSELRAVSITGRGGQWKVAVAASHDLPAIQTRGLDLLSTLQEFRTLIEEKDETT